MSFLYPQFLYGLVALSIPIIIHLFNFRRTKKVYYSSTHFLHLVKEASTSKLKIKHLLILASRLLFIFFMVLAFAQPFIPAKQRGLDSSEVYLYLDNSYSMSNEVGPDYRALDAGISFVNELIDLFPQGTQYRFFTNDFASSSKDFKSSAEVADLITETGYSGDIRSASEVWSRIGSSITESASNLPNKEVFWIGDFQKSTNGEINFQNMDSSLRLNIFPLTFDSFSNLYIDSVYLENPFIIGNEKIILSVQIANSGNNDALNVPIKIFLNDVQASNATLNVPAGSKIVQNFDLGFNLSSLNTGRIQIEDYPVTFDNDFYFTVDIGRKVSIMEIKSMDETTAVESVYGNQDLFSFRSFLFTNIDYSQIDQSDLVIINEVEQIDPSLSVLLVNYLDEGGTLAVIPSPDPDLSTYQTLAGSKLLRKTDSLFRQTLAAPNLDNPFYRNVFEESQSNISMPEATQSISWGADRTAILTFRSGQPFLSYQNSLGPVYWFAGPLDDHNSGFQNHAVFVPVMYKIAFGSKNIDSRLYYIVDEPVLQLGIDSIEQNTVIKLVSDENEFIPSQRVTSNSLFLELPPESIEPGFYDVRAKDVLITTLAFNFDPKESKLEQYNFNELETIFAENNNISIFNAADESEFTSMLKKQYKGTPYWKYALVFSLLFLLSEILLIRFL